jgi:hypothetical protein
MAYMPWPIRQHDDDDDDDPSQLLSCTDLIPRSPRPVPEHAQRIPGKGRQQVVLEVQRHLSVHAMAYQVPC